MGCAQCLVTKSGAVMVEDWQSWRMQPRTRGLPLAIVMLILCRNSDFFLRASQPEPTHSLKVRVEVRGNLRGWVCSASRAKNMAWLDLDSLVVGLVIFALVWEAKLRLQQWFFPPRPAKHLVEVVD